MSGTDNISGGYDTARLSATEQDRIAREEREAAALGMTYATFKSNVSRGRSRFLAAWHEGEKPSRPWGCDRRVGSYGRRMAGAA